LVPFLFFSIYFFKLVLIDFFLFHSSLFGFILFLRQIWFVFYWLLFVLFFIPFWLIFFFSFIHQYLLNGDLDLWFFLDFFSIWLVLISWPESQILKISSGWLGLFILFFNLLFFQSWGLRFMIFFTFFL
jgi:hypothetical protein